MNSKTSIITEKDVLILKELLEDGRRSSSSISKQIDLGREIVNYRIKRLIKENLIVKFIPKINDNAINYREYTILLKLNLDDDVSKEKFIREKIGNKYLIWIIKSSQGWDLMVRLYASSIPEFKLKLAEILELFSDILSEYYTIISSEEIKECEKAVLCENLFHDKVINKDFSTIKNEIIEIDKKDKEIISLLEEDGRVQYKEIAEKINVSSDTVKYRIERMKKGGIIENFSLIVNFNKLGMFQYSVILKFKFLNTIFEKEINNYIINSSCIIKAIKSLNIEEYFLNLVFDSKSGIDDFEEEINLKFKDKIKSIEIFKLG